MITWYIVKIIMAKMYIHNCKFLNIKPLFSALASEIKKKKRLWLLLPAVQKEKVIGLATKDETHISCQLQSCIYMLCLLSWYANANHW